MSEHLVLVVEDDPAIRSVVTDALTDDGFVVATAGDGESALHLAEVEHPDVIVLDRALPILNGDGVARALRLRGDFVPIIAMTATPDARSWARRIGAVACLPKPIDLYDLCSTVEHVCSMTET